MSTPSHRPVMVQQVVEGLAPRRDGVIVDATVGVGGHAEALLEAEPTLRLVGFDVDPTAVAVARERLARFAPRARVVHGSYRELVETLESIGVGPVDGVLFDFGVSSLQLDTPSRGFSFRHDAPLDMRFSGTGVTAGEVLAGASEEELVRVLSEFGEEPRARRLARAIVRARQREPIRSTGQLHRLVRSVLGGSRGRVDPATRTFQALRIATNSELEGIPPALDAAAHRLAPEGRLVAIAFHSLEDRLVKQALRRLAGRCICPPGTMICRCEPEELLEILTSRPLRPGDQEISENPRARSARLRIARRRRP
ncbi:MAG: 16S rRNA (cytosine(1402)-N(4))-methyltransferase RsmH [Acidobacteriota bacterium]